MNQFKSELNQNLQKADQQIADHISNDHPLPPLITKQDLTHYIHSTFSAPILKSAIPIFKQTLQDELQNTRDLNKVKSRIQKSMQQKMELIIKKHSNSWVMHHRNAYKRLKL